MRAELQKLYPSYVVVRTSLQIAIYLIVSNRYKTLGCCRQVALAYIIIMTAHLAKKTIFRDRAKLFNEKTCISLILWQTVLINAYRAHIFINLNHNHTRLLNHE